MQASYAFFPRHSRRLKTFPLSSFGTRCTTPLMKQLSSGGGPFLDLRRICGQLICMFNIAHCSINFPWHSVFAVPTHSGLRGHAFKIRQQRCSTRRHQHAFSIRAVQYWNQFPEEMVNVSSVEIFKARFVHRSSVLIPTVIFFPELALPYLIAPFCPFCNNFGHL